MVFLGPQDLWYGINLLAFWNDELLRRGYCVLLEVDIDFRNLTSMEVCALLGFLYNVEMVDSYRRFGTSYQSHHQGTLDAGMLARSQYPEGPATGHFDTGFSWFPCA